MSDLVGPLQGREGKGWESARAILFFSSVRSRAGNPQADARAPSLPHFLPAPARRTPVKPEAEQDAVMRRSYTRSSEKEILVQLRNSLNPYEKMETRIMVVQAFTAVVAVVCLLGIAIVGYTKIKDIRVSVQTVAVETTEMANLTSAMGDEMDLMVKTMEPVLLLPNITLEMEQMETGVNQLVSVPFLLLIHPSPQLARLGRLCSDPPLILPPARTTSFAVRPCLRLNAPQS